MVIAGIATYFNSRASIARQSPEAQANPQTQIMNRLALYVFPLGVVVGGPFLPIAIILYWVSNNIWTFGQQHYVFNHIAKEEEEKKQADLERRAANAPKPGAKPTRGGKNQPAKQADESDSTEIVESGGTDEDTGGQASPDSTNGSGTTSRTPKPGARPDRRRKR
jgi:YidC/Oxa1 family membrane protein insertase